MVTGREQPQCPIIRHDHVWPCCLTSCLLSLFATMFPTLPYIMDWVLFAKEPQEVGPHQDNYQTWKVQAHDQWWPMGLSDGFPLATCTVCSCLPVSRGMFFLDYILTCITHRYTNMTYMKGRAQSNYIEMQNMCASVCADAVAFKECLLFRCIEQFATQVFNTMK